MTWKAAVLFFLYFASTLSCRDSGRSKQLPEVVTYTQHVVSVLQEHCTGCHRNGGSAPFSLETYQQAAARINLISYAVRTHYMPPWKPDKNYSSFIGERGLSDYEINLIEKWKNQGTLYGSAIDLPIEILTDNYSSPPPALRLIPDSVFFVQPDGNDYFVTYFFSDVSDSTIYTNSIGFVPTNRGVTHHAGLLIDTSGQYRELGRNGNILIAAKNEFHIAPEKEGSTSKQPHSFIGLYTPGVEKTQLPGGIYYEIPAHSDFLVQVHYASHLQSKGPGSFELSVFPMNEAKSKKIHLMIIDEQILVPPFFIKGDSEATFTLRSQPLDKEMQVFRLFPHMHYRGTHFLAYALKPDNDTIPLIKIPEWDFRWQGSYVFKSPPLIPAGSVIVMKGEFDNTNNNPRNPIIPAVDIKGGMRSVDEMLQLWLEYTD